MENNFSSNVNSSPQLEENVPTTINATEDDKIDITNARSNIILDKYTEVNTQEVNIWIGTASNDDAEEVEEDDTEKNNAQVAIHGIEMHLY